MPNQQELEDYDDHETPDDLFEPVCPACGNRTVLSERCPQIACEGGQIDESDEDYCLEGTVMVKCSECQGTGFITWCPACGTDLTGKKLA